MTDYQAKKHAYLEHIPSNYKGVVANDFLGPVRAQGLQEPHLVCREVFKTYQRRLTQCLNDLDDEPRLRQMYSNTDWLDERMERERTDAAKWRKYLDLMRQEREKALGMAEWAIWWEYLDENEKKQLKAQGKEHYQQEHMAALQPTDKQLALLDSFGYQGTVDNRLHASQLIDEYITLKQDYKHRGNR